MPNAMLAPAPLGQPPLRSTVRAGLSVPAIAAPMFLVSGPEHVIACCRAGIVGSFPTINARTPEILDGWLAEMAKVHKTGQSQRWRCQTRSIVPTRWVLNPSSGDPRNWARNAGGRLTGSPAKAPSSKGESSDVLIAFISVS